MPPPTPGSKELLSGQGAPPNPTLGCVNLIQLYALNMHRALLVEQRVGKTELGLLG